MASLEKLREDTIEELVCLHDATKKLMAFAKEMIPEPMDRQRAFDLGWTGAQIISAFRTVKEIEEFLLTAFAKVEELSRRADSLSKVSAPPEECDEEEPTRRLEDITRLVVGR